jgi:hypothetical protein
VPNPQVEPHGNENAPAQGQGARKFESQLNKSRSQSGFNNKDYEDRRNAAACFKNEKSEDWHADYKGVLVSEDLPAGAKCWVNVYVRTSRKGEKYLSVVLKRQGT